MYGLSHQDLPHMLAEALKHSLLMLSCLRYRRAYVQVVPAHRVRKHAAVVQVALTVLHRGPRGLPVLVLPAAEEVCV